MENFDVLYDKATDTVSIVGPGGTTTKYVNASVAPSVGPTDTEVDILLSDGTVKKFKPA